MDFQSLDNLINMMSTSADLTTLILNLKQLGLKVMEKLCRIYGMNFYLQKTS